VANPGQAMGSFYAMLFARHPGLRRDDEQKRNETSASDLVPKPLFSGVETGVT
jgi:hypothetical protein